MLGELFAYLFVGEYRLDSGLCVVEVALYRADGDIAALLRGHLELLHGADALIGIEHENFRVLNILEAFESRLARVARGGDKNDGFARTDGFPDGDCHEPREHLKRHIFKSAGGAAPELEYLLARSEFVYGRYILGGKLVITVCALDAVGKLLGGEIGKIQSEYAFCALDI